MSHKLLTRVFYIFGLALAASLVFSLVTGDVFDNAVYETAQRNFNTTWRNTTWNNGLGYNQTTTDKWVKLKKNNEDTCVVIGEEDSTDYVNRGWYNPFA